MSKQLTVDRVGFMMRAGMRATIDKKIEKKIQLRKQKAKDERQEREMERQLMENNSELALSLLPPGRYQSQLFRHPVAYEGLDAEELPEAERSSATQSRYSINPSED